MFENVLVGVDGRPAGRDAIALAGPLRAPGGQLTLAHVHGGELHPVNAISPGTVAHERSACEQLLEDERTAAGVQARLVSVAAMSPGGGLHRQAEAQGADLLVVGSCGRGVLGRTMLGDDTRAALNGAPCAVAIASRGYAERPLPLARIGVGYDDSPESIAALELARRLAEPTRASVQALQVVSLPSYAFTGMMPTMVGESIDALLHEAGERLRSLPGVQGRAVYGLPGEELAAFSEELDLLVVGSRSYGPLRRLVLGSTSDYLERHARCSLLVLPRLALQDGAPQEGAPQASETDRHAVA